MVRLLKQDLGAFALFHMEGIWDADGRQMVEAIKRVAGQPGLKVKPFPWWLLPLAAPLRAAFPRIDRDALSVADAGAHDE